MDQASHASGSLDGPRPFAERAVWTYLFTICEYGGGETASCRLTCGEEFADGFELGVQMRIDEETHYSVREEIAEGEFAGHVATLEPWIETA
jgi:hypothetical protein